MFNKKIIYIITTAISLLGVLFYFSLNSVLAFVGFATFNALPYLLGAIQIAAAILCLIFTLHKPNKIGIIVLFVWTVIFMALCITLLVLFGGNITDILMQGLLVLLIMIAIAMVVFVIFYLPKLEFKNKKIISIIICAVFCLAIVVGFTDLKNLRINYIKQGAVVYAVNTDYQIVWTTEVKGIGYVTVNGLTFYDTVAGSMVSEERVHKVIVPQAVLNEAKSYTIHTKKMIAEQGFSANMGREIAETYNFRPIDESDGIQFFSVADTHDSNNPPAKAAKYFGDKTDFVIMAGDMVSFLENETDLNRIVNLASMMTNGEIPVVFARGNHELKSEKSERLYRYVGADNTNFYYTFRIGSVWGVVLDMGEDHDDSWYEFYGTAVFDAYRKAQIDFLDKVIADSANEYGQEGVTLKIGVCHIPTAFTGFVRDYMYSDLINLNVRLNQIGLSSMISGHLHEVFVTENDYAAGTPLTYMDSYNGMTNTEPYYLATGAEYYNIICSKRSRSQRDKEKAGRYFTGAALEWVDNELILKFINDSNTVVSTVSPFENKDYGKIITIK